MHTQNTQYRMHYITLACTKRWILFIKYNTSYTASVLLNFKYIHIHTQTCINTRFFWKTISKSQNIPQNHHKYLHIRKIFHICFKNEMFLALQKSKILIVRQ